MQNGGRSFFKQANNNTDPLHYYIQRKCFNGLCSYLPILCLVFKEPKKIAITVADISITNTTVNETFIKTEFLTQKFLLSLS